LTSEASTERHSNKWQKVAVTIAVPSFIVASSGASLLVWVRERLSQVAIKELEAVGHPISFFKKAELG